MILYWTCPEVLNIAGYMSTVARQSEGCMKNRKWQILVGLLLALMVGSNGTAARAETISALVGLQVVDIESPAGIALDGEETLFVAESTKGYVAVIENSGARLADIVGFQQPVSVAVDANEGLLYVGDAGAGSVLVFGADLAFRGRLGVGNGEFGRPVGIAVDAHGNVLVVDGDRNTVKVFGADAVLKLAFGQSGSNAGQIRHPVSIAVDRGTNEIIVVDRPILTSTSGKFEGSRVQIFDAAGKYLRGFGQYGTGEGKLAKATGVAADHAGRIYVADAELNVVTAFDRTGQYLETIYDATSVMSTPVGVTIGGLSGRLFVSSISVNRVNVYGVNAQHAVTAESSSGGTITPAGQLTVVRGAGLSFTAQPDPGYHIEAVLVDGVDLGTDGQFSLPVVLADQQVFVQFSKDFHTVTVEGSAGGTVSPSGAVLVQHKTPLVIGIMADPGWRIADVEVDGLSQDPVDSYVFNSITEDHTVRVTFARIAYSITATAGIGGSITPAGILTVFQGADRTFSITPAIGYQIAGLYVDNVALTPVDTYSFTNIMASHEIRVAFEREVLEISASASVGGSITPTGVVNVLYGDSMAFSMIPDQGNHISEVYVDSNPIGASGRYEFSAVTEPHAIRVEFARNRYAITATSQGNGVVSPAGIITALYGNSMTFAFTPRAGYHVAMILIDGQAVEISDALTFTDINANHSLTVFFAETNDLPVALAGPDQTAYGPVVLNGEHSFDSDGAIVSYLWEQMDGLPVTLLDPTSAKASFVTPAADSQGNALLFRLTVTDNKGATAADECLITLAGSNRPPVADAGLDQVVVPGETVVLDGSSSIDNDGRITSWIWQQVSGRPVQLTQIGNAMVSFVAPEGDSALVFRLLVTDNVGLMAKDDCLVNITASKNPPVAEAGANLLVREGETVDLDGLGSLAGSGSIRSYLWKQISGTPAVSLLNYRTGLASFVAPLLEQDATSLTFELLVTDQAGLVATDRVTVRINKALAGSSSGLGTLAKISKSKWVTVAIELPDGFTYDTIMTSTIAVTRINGRTVAPALKRTGPLEIGDSNRNGILELVVKFDRERLIGLLGSGVSIITVSGSLQDGSEFQQEFRIAVND